MISGGMATVDTKQYQLAWEGAQIFMQILQKILQEIQKRRQWFQRNPKIINLQECKYPGS